MGLRAGQRQRSSAVGLAALLLGACQSGPAARPDAIVPALPIPDALARSPLSAREKADHLLHRITYGPRPGEVDDLAKGGDAAIWAYLLAQLTPESIDDSAVEAKLTVLPTLRLSNAQLLADFPSLNELAKQRGVDLGNDEAKRALQNQIDPDRLARRIDEDLETAKLVRAVESHRQLQAVLADFWFNHFNIDIDKGDVRWLLTSYQREAISPHMFGHFRELLAATAHDPAMLFYLDNFQSVREQAPNPKRPNAPLRGLNENYARELMELHTLGVNGGYTQTDVREAARCLTGWGIDKPRQVAVFAFHPREHDEGPKTVLGHPFPPGQGESDGEQLLDLLAANPATAHFLATKLARRFVADTPPPELVETLARRYLDTQGDLRELYLALFSNPAFWSREAYRAKVKTPLEVAVSAVRVLDGHLDSAGGLINEINKMGERLFHCQPPTGYADEAAAWVNSGSLVARLNFGLRLATNKVGGVHGHLLPFAPGRRQADPAQFVDLAASTVLSGDLTPETRAVLVQELSVESRTMPDGERRPLDVGRLGGLLIGSPEFQRR